MNTCETCRFWQLDFLLENPTSDWNVAGFRVCRCPIFIDGHPDSWQRGEVAGSKICILSVDAPAEFLTGPEFGCVHHEAK